MSCVNKASFSFLVSTLMPLFLFPAQLLWLDYSSTMLNRSGKSIRVLFLILRGKQSFTIKLMLAVGFHECLYQFAVAAVTNYDKLGGLKQHKCIIFQCWRLEVQYGFHWAKTKVPEECVPFWSLPGSCPCLFQLLKATHIPWPMAPFLHFQSQQHGISLTFLPQTHRPLADCSRKGPHFKDSSDQTGPIAKSLT